MNGVRGELRAGSCSHIHQADRNVRPPYLTRRFEFYTTLVEINTLGARGQQFEAATIHSTDRIKHGVHAHGLDLADLRHQFAKPPFWETSFEKPTQILLRKIHDRNSGWRIGFDAKLSEGDPCITNFDKEIPKVIPIDFSEIRHGDRLELCACSRRRLRTICLES